MVTDCNSNSNSNSFFFGCFRYDYLPRRLDQLYHMFIKNVFFTIIITYITPNSI